jgi:hypothetical protein
MSFIFRQYLIAEFLLEVLSDDENDFAEAGLNGIIDGIIHDGFPVRAQPVELLKPTITAAHAGSKK